MLMMILIKKNRVKESPECPTEKGGGGGGGGGGKKKKRDKEGPGCPRERGGGGGGGGVKYDIVTLLKCTTFQ